MSMLGRHHSAQSRAQMRAAHLQPEVRQIHVEHGKKRASQPNLRLYSAAKISAAWKQREGRSCIHCDFTTKAYHLFVESEMTNGALKYECRSEMACNRRISALLEAS
jgi:hypothetical protein